MTSLEADHFLKQVFRLGEDIGGLKFAEITQATYSFLEKKGKKPTPQDIIDFICIEATDRVVKRIQRRSEPKGKEEYRKTSPKFSETSLLAEILSGLLGISQSEAKSLIKNILHQRKKGQHFSISDILPAVEELHHRGRSVTVNSTVKTILSLQSKEAGANVRKSASKESNRKHVSVWEIRN